MSKRQRKDGPNDDLVEAAEFFLPQILRFSKLSEEKRPVMLLDLPSQKISPGARQLVRDKRRIA